MTLTLSGGKKKYKNDKLVIGYNKVEKESIFYNKTGKIL